MQTGIAAVVAEARSGGQELSAAATRYRLNARTTGFQDFTGPHNLYGLVGEMTIRLTHPSGFGRRPDPQDIAGNCCLVIPRFPGDWEIVAAVVAELRLNS